MSNDDSSIEINFIDHVAIRVKDFERSIEWYKKVLGLKKHQLPKWNPYPIFLLAGKCGVALFPADINSPNANNDSSLVKIDHFAFNVSNDSFHKAKNKYKDLGLEFTVKDHHYFHSIYTKDPDGHIVELITIMVDEDSFYKINKKHH
ncbi:MAG: catechol 2,3-dioxygenase-like lactoylglutathione lyase family enzyme [Saprospiraceae bacterium]|jgi:catechol 2,3-dioxygenase-like lactoylglutathione lyase family enzyme